MIRCRDKGQVRTEAFQVSQTSRVDHLSWVSRLNIGAGFVSSVLLGAIATALIPFAPAEAVPLSFGQSSRDKAVSRKVSPAQAKQGRTPFTPAESFFIQPDLDPFAVAQPVVEPVEPLLAQRGSALPSDGVYLFGQQPIPDQLQTAYLVFEAQADNIVGAFYMPHSSFDCVQGALQDTELALTITESYSQEVYNYALALDRDVSVASTGIASAVNIEGFHPIEDVSANDMEILEACKSFYDGAI